MTVETEVMNVVVQSKSISGITLTTLDLKASKTIVAAGGSVAFTVTAYDQDGSIMPSQEVYFTESGVQYGPYVTGDNGQVSQDLQFETIGEYTIHAESGDIKSNGISVMVTVKR